MIPTRSLAALSLALLAACQASGAADEASLGRAASFDGLEIAYEVRGRGEPALVFVHGWACDRSHWDAQLEAFAPEHRVVALDLGGHGESGAERASWSVEGLGADVVAVVEELGLSDLILVGHSMGGPVALAAAAALPGRVRAVVGVDSLHSAELVMSAEAVAGWAASLEADFPAVVRVSVEAMFGEGAEPALVERVARESGRSDPAAAVALVRSFAGVDLALLMGQAGVPVRCINAAPRPPVGPPTLVEVNRRYADFDAVLVPGVGHYLMLEAPRTFNAELAGVIASLD